MNKTLEKKIKKNIYGSPQTIHAIAPAGLGDTALTEAQSILNTPWFPQKYTSTFTLIKNDIRIANIHMFAITELLIRSQCLSDVRLVIYEGKTASKTSFKKKCSDINWAYFLDNNMTVKIKVNSVASIVFHETALKEILSEIIQDQVRDIVSGENTDETTCLYVDLYKNKLKISLSLAGNSLYKRNYRGTLSASAPLREDSAICCILKSIEFAHKKNPELNADTLIIPFSGTGTFGFEYLLHHYQIAPALLGRDYALQKMPLFKSEHFNFLIKKAKEYCLLSSPTRTNSPHLYFIDTSEKANNALNENLQTFKQAILKNFNENEPSEKSIFSENFVSMDLTKFQNKSTIFIPMNPPYGIRLGNPADSINLYKQIAEKINELSKVIKPKHLFGFILCPSEETWSIFTKTIKQATLDTYHITQGGLDIRVCQFFLNTF